MTAKLSSAEWRGISVGCGLIAGVNGVAWLATPAASSGPLLDVALLAMAAASLALLRSEQRFPDEKLFLSRVIGGLANTQQRETEPDSDYRPVALRKRRCDDGDADYRAQCIPALADNLEQRAGFQARVLSATAARSEFCHRDASDKFKARLDRLFLAALAADAGGLAILALAHAARLIL